MGYVRKLLVFWKYGQEVTQTNDVASKELLVNEGPVFTFFALHFFNKLKHKIMKYYFEKTTDYAFDEAVEKVTEELKKEGFGILTEIDVRATLKNKLDVDFRKYQILGACNPPFAHKALQAENKIGAMLPCNVIVQELDNGKTEIAVVDPAASMQAVDNDKLGEIADEIRSKLEKVIQAV